MSPIENELLAEFQAIFLEVLVPLRVQRRIPAVRAIWKEVIGTDKGSQALQTLFKESLRTPRSVGETIRLGIAGKDPHVRTLKHDLYTRIGRNEALIRAYMARPITNGNEQCPYWDGFKYSNAPKQ